MFMDVFRNVSISPSMLGEAGCERSDGPFQEVSSWKMALGGRYKHASASGLPHSQKLKGQ